MDINYRVVADVWWLCDCLQIYSDSQPKGIANVDRTHVIKLQPQVARFTGHNRPSSLQRPPQMILHFVKC